MYLMLSMKFVTYPFAQYSTAISRLMPRLYLVGIANH